MYILHQTSVSIYDILTQIIDNLTLLPKHMDHITHIYKAIDMKVMPKHGNMICTDGINNARGMALDVQYASLLLYFAHSFTFQPRNISFTYPGRASHAAALHNISFTVQSGDLVVIVGRNGSGKSTLLNLLTGIYTPTSGKILVNGRPKEHYSSCDLRRATAHLSQDHQLFPLSVSENISLGMPSGIPNSETINHSAKDGGSLAFIRKLPHGFETIINPVRTAVMAVPGRNNDDAALVFQYDGIERGSNISGAFCRFCLS